MRCASSSTITSGCQALMAVEVADHLLVVDEPVEGRLGVLVAAARPVALDDLHGRSVNLRISVSHWYLTDAGATTSTRSTPRSRASSSTAASVWTVLPRPMSSPRMHRPR